MFVNAAQYNYGEPIFRFQFGALISMHVDDDNECNSSEMFDPMRWYVWVLKLVIAVATMFQHMQAVH